MAQAGTADMETSAKQFLTDMLASGQYDVLARAGHYGWKAMKEAQGFTYGPRKRGRATNPNLVDFEDLSKEASDSNYVQARSVVAHFRNSLRGPESVGTLIGMLRDFYREGFAYLLGGDPDPFVHRLGRNLHEHFVSSKVQLGYVKTWPKLPKKARDDLVGYENIPAEYQVLNVMSSMWIIGGLLKEMTGEEQESLPKPEVELIKPYLHSSKPSEAERFLTDVIDKFVYYQAAKGVHEGWRALKAAQGWTYGKETDRDKKTNKNMVDFEDLSPKIKFSNVITPRSTVLHYLDVTRDFGLDMASLYSIFQYHMSLRKRLDNGEVPNELLPVSDRVHEHFWTAKMAAGETREDRDDLLPLEMLPLDVISWDTGTALETLEQLSYNPFSLVAR